MGIKKKTIKPRSVTSHRNRVHIHLSSYWWAGISNYVSNTISVITKIYIFLLYFSSVSLLIIRSQTASIAWTVTSTAHFTFVEVTRMIMFYEIDVLYIFDINIVLLMRHANLFEFWFDKRQLYVIFTHA